MKTTQLLTSAFMITLALLAGCKKDKTSPEPATPAPTTNTTPAKFSGILTSGYYTTLIPGTFNISAYNAQAYFSSTPVQAYSPATAVRVNHVYVNADSLFYSSSTGFYQSGSIASIPSETWKADGANGIPSFTLVNQLTIPSCDSIISIPDSISKSAGLTLTVLNISNMIDGYISILDGTSGVPGHFSTPLVNGNNTVIISAADLSSLNISTNAIIAIAMQNKSVQTAGGSNFQFIRQRQYIKHIKIKP